MNLDLMTDIYSISYVETLSICDKDLIKIILKIQYIKISIQNKMDLELVLKKYNYIKMFNSDPNSKTIYIYKK